MMGWTKFFWIALFSVWSMSAMAGGPDYDGPGVGEDPFPLMCTNFSGDWKSDSGNRYIIDQPDCSWLRIQMYSGSISDTLTIVPDNRLRPGPKNSGTVRYRWNTLKNAKRIEGHFVSVLRDIRVTENSTLERASPNLMLLTVYRTIERVKVPGQKRNEYRQEVFRRQNTGTNPPAFRKRRKQ